MSDRATLASRLLPSATAELEGKVEELVARGVDVCRLGLGEPDIPTPEHVREAAIAAIREDFSRYTSTAGIEPLRAAVARTLREDQGLVYEPREIVISTGGKQSILNALAALCGAGDEVLIPVPYWVSFPEQVRLVGATPVLVPTSAEHGFRARAADVERLLTPRSRVLVLNSPNNPSGAVYPRSELAELARLCRERDLWVVSDEVYATFVFTEEGHVSIASFDGMRDRTVVVNGVSKTFGMTGWRIGFAAAPAAVAGAMTRVQGHVTSNPNSIAQRAALAAFSGPRDWLAAVRREYAQRRLTLARGVQRLRGLDCAIPDGSFYVWVDASGWIGQEVAGTRIARVEDLATLLLERERVAVMPGTGFGDPTRLRLSFAAPAAELEEGLARMKTLLGERAR